MNKIKNPFGNTPGEIKSYKKGLEEGALHAVSSPETKENMAKINSSIDVLVTKMEGLTEIVKTNHEESKQEFKDFRQETKDSFIGVKKRQDHTNGNVTDLQLKDAERQGMYKNFTIIFSLILLPVIIAVITSFITLRDQSIRQEQYNKNIEEKINQMSADHSKIEDEIKTQASMAAKQEIEDFANKNFDNYNK